MGSSCMHRAASRRGRVKRDLQPRTASLAARTAPRYRGAPTYGGHARCDSATPEEQPMLTKLKLALLISAPLIAGAATYAAAQGSAPSHQTLIQKFDKNGDGVLDDAERADMKAALAAKRAAHRQAMLDKYDTNKDGKLEPAERTRGRGTPCSRCLHKENADHSGGDQNSPARPVQGRRRPHAAPPRPVRAPAP